MKNNLTTFQYKENSIAFQNDENVMVNATEMAKIFGKKISRFLEDPNRRGILNILCTRNSLNISEADTTASLKINELSINDWAERFPESIQVVKGGVGQQGTWMHEDVAIEFSRWLNPEFAIWCNDRIKELTKFGMTALPETLDEMISDPNLVIKLATQVRDAREQLALAEAATAKSQHALIEAQPKVDFADAVMDSGETIGIDTMAAILDIGRTTFFRKLREDGVLMDKGSHYNRPYRKLVDCGYFDVAENTYIHGGRPKVNVFVSITPKGQMWLTKKYGSTKVIAKAKSASITMGWIKDISREVPIYRNSGPRAPVRKIKLSSGGILFFISVYEKTVNVAYGDKYTSCGRINKDKTSVIAGGIKVEYDFNTHEVTFYKNAIVEIGQ